jgi:hypothetical protein
MLGTVLGRIRNDLSYFKLVSFVLTFPLGLSSILMNSLEGKLMLLKMPLWRLDCSSSDDYRSFHLE